MFDDQSYRARAKRLVCYIRNYTLQKNGESAFDPVFYEMFYDDAADGHFDSFQLLEHYNSVGKQEKRYFNIEQLMKVTESTPSDLPLDFNSIDYYVKNFDLAPKYPTILAVPIEHYLHYGRRENRFYRIPYTDKSQFNLNTALVKTSSKKVAVLIHIFYPELWLELLNYVRQLQDIKFDLYINFVESAWSEKTQSDILANMPNAKIIVSKNCGRDIGGFIYLMRTINFNDYDIFCLLHSKRSLHSDPSFGEMWRKRLCDALLKNFEKASENIALIRSNPMIGMIGCGKFRASGIMQNAKHFTSLLEKFAIKEDARSCEFLAGTMMMIRPEILKPLLQLNPEEMEACDNLTIQQQIDGLMSHAVERVIGNLVRHFGYTFFWQTED